MVVATWRMHQHESTGAQPGQRRLRDKRSQHRRDRRVDGITALAQDPRSGLSRQRMSSSDYSALPTHGAKVSQTLMSKFRAAEVVRGKEAAAVVCKQHMRRPMTPPRAASAARHKLGDVDVA